MKKRRDAEGLRFRETEGQTGKQAEMERNR
jgi:hypothetical protein